MIWELCNECRCRWGHESLYEWQKAMSRELKVLAPRQLVGLGGDGFYFGEDDTDVGYDAYMRNPRPLNDPFWYVHEGNDFLSAAALPSVDVVGYHLHPLALHPLALHPLTLHPLAGGLPSAPARLGARQRRRVAARLHQAVALGGTWRVPHLG